MRDTAATMESVQVGTLLRPGPGYSLGGSGLFVVLHVELDQALLAAVDVTSDFAISATDRLVSIPLTALSNFCPTGVLMDMSTKPPNDLG